MSSQRRVDKRILAVWVPLPIRVAFDLVSKYRGMAYTSSLIMEYLADGLRKDAHHLEFSGFNVKDLIKQLEESSADPAPRGRKTKKSPGRPAKAKAKK